MRIQQIVFFLSICFLFSFNVIDQKTEIAESIIEVFKNDKVENLIDFYPKTSDFESISKDITDEKIKKEFLEHYIERFKNKTNGIKTNYSLIRNKGNYLGINWIETELINVELDKQFEKNNVTYSDILIKLKSNEKEFTIKLDDCILSKEKGWLILDEIKLKE